VKEPVQSGKKNKISFDANMPDSMTDDEKMQMSYDLLIAQGGIKSDTTLWKANPVLFRQNKYLYTVDSDVLNPRSADLERAFSLELYDRAINSPVANQENLYKDFLLATDPKSARDPDKYVTKQPPTGTASTVQPGALGAPEPGVPTTPPKTGSIAKPNAPILPDQRKPVIPR